MNLINFLSGTGWREVRRYKFKWVRSAQHCPPGDLGNIMSTPRNIKSTISEVFSMIQVQVGLCNNMSTLKTSTRQYLKYAEYMSGMYMIHVQVGPVSPTLSTICNIRPTNQNINGYRSLFAYDLTES
jgi:hypothetical protein